jgi:hypothetical protein
MQQANGSYNYRERYDPCKVALNTLDEVEQPADIQVVQAPAGETRNVVGINNAPPAVQAAMIMSERFAKLKDPAEN